MRAKSKQTGFTIVELLIVIVVIGILAAITIVTYAGISQRATATSLKSDLNGASKQLRLYQVDNSGYPIGIDCNTTPAANTICLKSSNGTTYTTFTPNNTTNPQTFCITATNGTANYFVNQDGTPASGACSVTNLVLNPVPASSSGYGTTGSHTITWNSGTNALGVSGYVTSAPNSGNTDGRSFRMDLGLLPSRSYAFTAYARIVAGPVVGLRGMTIRYDTWGNFAVTNCTTSNPAINTWVRLQCIFTAPDVSYTSTYGIVIATVGSVSTTIDTSNWTVTEGPTIYSYADGSSQNWIWNGTSNGSTSTGPPL